MKKMFLVFAILLFFPSSCFAEIKTSLVQFKNTFTVTSERVIEISPAAELTCYITKTYSKDLSKPILDMRFLISGNDYYFFAKEFDYIIDGGTTGNSATWQIKNSSSPGGKTGLLYSWGGRIMNESDKICKAIQGDKSVLFRINFNNQPSYQFKLTPECVQEWKTVLNYDLVKEAEKLKNKPEQ